MKGLRTLALALATSLAPAALADVATVPLNGTNASDNFLYNNGPTSNFGGSQLYYYDNRGASLDKGRPLIKFNLPTLPAGATIQNVQLGLWIVDYTFIDTNNGNALVPWPFSLHRMLVDWNQNTSNWNNRSTGTPWNTPGLGAGTDYDPTAAATAIVSTSSTTTGQYKTWDITTLYQGWVAGTYPNYGVCIQGPAGNPALTTATGDTTDGVFRAANSEWEDDNVRPRLIITYALASSVACCFTNGTCQPLTVVDCTTAGGVAQAAGSVCSPNPCPQPTGACCNGTTCTISTVANCTAGGGTAQAAGSVCSPNPCNAMVMVALDGTNCFDNFLYNNGPTSNFANSQLYYYDERGTVLDKGRPLMKFSLPTLPDCAVVLNAQLQLWVIDYTFVDAANGNAVVAWPFSLHRMLVDWDETTSTWNERSAGNAWSTPGMAAGTDYASVASATTVIDSNSVTSGLYKSWDITSLYQSWASGTAPNFGVCILGPAGNPALTGPSGDTTDGVFRAANSEYSTVGNRPKLVVTYTVQCVACCFANGTCQNTSTTACSAAGGTAQAAGSVCSPNPCPVPSGACCCGSHCSITLAAGCTGSNKFFAGAGTSCTPFSMTAPCCRGDYNKTGVPASVQDIFDFLSGYFSNDACADSNDSGTVSVQDIFDFLSAYFGGC